jgi:hypothetical protein
MVPLLAMASTEAAPAKCASCATKIRSSSR